MNEKMFTPDPYDGERRGETIGFPLPEVAIRIVNEEKPLPGSGEVAQILVRGRSILSTFTED